MEIDLSARDHGPGRRAQEGGIHLRGRRDDLSYYGRDLVMTREEEGSIFGTPTLTCFRQLLTLLKTWDPISFKTRHQGKSGIDPNK